MIRLVLAIAALVAFSGVGQAQLLIQGDEGGVELASKILPELEGKATLHFVYRSFYFTDGHEFAVFRLGNGDTLKLIYPNLHGWSLRALKQPARPVVIVLKSNDKELNLEIVQNSPLEKRLVELMEADLLGSKHSPENAKILAGLRDSLRSRQPSPEEKEVVELLLSIYRDPSAAPPEYKEFYDAWRKSLTSEAPSPTEPATDPDSKEEPSSPAR